MITSKLTISGLIVLILICALGLAAMGSASVLWTQIVTTAALTILLIATVGALVGSERAFWIGFAVVGWSYLFLSLGPWCAERVGPWLLSTRALDEMFLRTNVGTRVLQKPGLPQSFDIDGHLVGWRQSSDYIHFQWKGHALAAILHGVLGGVVATVLGSNPRTDGRRAR